MSDTASNVEIEDVLASVRRLVSSERKDRRDTGAPKAQPANDAMNDAAGDAGRLVLTADLRVAGGEDRSGAEAAPVDSEFPEVDEAGEDEAAFEDATAVAMAVDEPPWGEPDTDAPTPVNAAEDAVESARILTLEERIAQLEAAVVTHASADFEPDGSEDQTQHRPTRILGLSPQDIGLDPGDTGPASADRRSVEPQDDAGWIETPDADLPSDDGGTADRDDDALHLEASTAAAGIEDLAEAEGLQAESAEADDTLSDDVEIGTAALADAADLAEDVSVGDASVDEASVYEADIAVADGPVFNWLQTAPADAPDAPAVEEDAGADLADAQDVDGTGETADDSDAAEALAGDADDELPWQEALIDGLPDEADDAAADANPFAMGSDSALDDAQTVADAMEPAAPGLTEAEAPEDDGADPATFEESNGNGTVLFPPRPAAARSDPVADAADPDDAEALPDPDSLEKQRPHGHEAWDERLYQMHESGEVTGLDFAEETQEIDEEMLRDMVAEIVRDELQGALGERITRNVRKLVRREIMRALSIRDFE